jgi:ATP diphosphatase
VSAAAQAMERLLALMARLRDPQGGCPWDLKQTFASIAPYTIEEAYEVADAIEQGQPGPLRDELGDLLFQVVFHARMAEERGWFSFADVAHGIEEKLRRRHPHVFAGAALAPEELGRAWEEHKARERAGAGATGTLSGVPMALPALVRAMKLSKRAARVGFEWTDAVQVRAKVIEELGEVDAAVAESPGNPGASVAVHEELGDLMFALVNWSRHLEVDAESALRAANAKFAKRFAHMERLARERQRELASLSIEEWEALWREAKLNPS